MNQFYFYESYARSLCRLTHKEAGQLTKAICGYMFLDKEPNERTTPKARALFYLLYEQLTDEKSKKSVTAKRNIEHFTFLLSYAKFIETLNDEETGLLIKQCCNFMFGTPPLSAEEEGEIDGYFSIIKTSLSKSKRQSANAKRHKKNKAVETVIFEETHGNDHVVKAVTLESIRADFPEIRGNLNTNNTILYGVNLNELYEFIKCNEDLRGISMYGIVERFRQQKGI